MRDKARIKEMLESVSSGPFVASSKNFKIKESLELISKLSKKELEKLIDKSSENKPQEDGN